MKLRCGGPQFIANSRLACCSIMDTWTLQQSRYYNIIESTSTLTVLCTITVGDESVYACRFFIRAFIVPKANNVTVQIWKGRGSSVIWCRVKAICGRHTKVDLLGRIERASEL